MGRLPPMHPRTLRLLAAAIPLLAAACITRPVEERVYNEGGLEILLRSEARFGRTLEKGYDHPIVVSPVRVTHILSRLDIRTDVKEGNDRVGAIPTEMLYPLGEAISQALAKAKPDQELVVVAIRRFKRWGVFDRRYLTSFVTYVQNDQLYIHLVRSDWEIPKRKKDKLPPTRIGDHPMGFRVFAGTAMTIVDPQSVAVDWRDPIFQAETRTKVLPTGEVVRRTILLESPPSPAETAAPALPDDLSPEQLRALADLEEARRNGEMTESEYQAKRRKILNPL